VRPKDSFNEKFQDFPASKAVPQPTYATGSPIYSIYIYICMYVYIYMCVCVCVCVCVHVCILRIYGLILQPSPYLHCLQDNISMHILVTPSTFFTLSLFLGILYHRALLLMEANTFF